MLETLVFPLLLQLSTLPDEFYKSEFTEEVREVLSEKQDDPDSLVSALDELADAGDISALEALGEIHNGGVFGVPRNTTLACDYFERVGNRRPDSLHNLATCFWSGNGRPKDQAKARELYIQAAERGWRMSFCAYGNMLVRGEGGPIDAEEGLRLCRMTALTGDADAQTDYGTYLLTGQGTERDPVAARFVLEQAGAQGQANASFLLGQIYTKGDGTRADDGVAAEWFEKAYDNGRGDAAFEVAKSYFRQGYKPNDDETYSVNKAALMTAMDWIAIAKTAERSGSTRQAEIFQLEQVISNVLGAIDKTGEGN